MSWIRSLGSGGGGGQPSQIFLYKNGVDNTTLTGGLTDSGFSWHSSYTNGGVIEFNSDNIRVAVTNQGTRYKMFGTAAAVDLTRFKSIIVNYTCNNVEGTSSLDVTTLTGQYYIACVIDFVSNANAFTVIAADTKVNMVQSSNMLRTGKSVDSSAVYVKSIELIPYTYAKTTFGDYLKEAFVSSNRPSQWTGSSFTYSNPKITYAEDSITISGSAPVSGYCATILSNLQIDVTDIKTVNVTVLASQSDANEQTRFALCDEISNGYVEDVSQAIAGAVSDSPVTLSLDTSNIIGNKYLNICCYCAMKPFSIKLTDIELVPISQYDDIKVVTNGVLNSQFNWSKTGNSLGITEYASSHYTYFLDNAGGTFGYLNNINTNNLKYLKMDVRFNSGNGTPYASKSYPQDGQKSSISTTRTTYTFDIQGYSTVSPSIGTASGSYAVEVYNIWLTNNN